MRPLFAAGCVICLLGVACSQTDLKLIPSPQLVEVHRSLCNWSDGYHIVLAVPANSDDGFAADQLREEAGRTPSVGKETSGSHLEVLIGALDQAAVSAEVNRLGIDLAPLAGKSAEAYLLAVRPDRIIAAGNGPAGTFYAIQTLKQLLRGNSRNGAIPCVTILDWPGLPLRGYSDDISRGPIPTMEFFKREIRTMSEFKQNMLTFYTEHVFKLDKHPIIAPPDGITAEEVRELSAYARKHHVELVGNFQSFGHFHNILRHEQYANLRETGSVITPAKEESYQFLDEVYSEICPAYESKLFNVNCDETWGLGEGPSKELAAQIGVGGVYLRHMNRIHDMLRDKYGKRMMMWGDIALQHPDIIDQLAKDTILLSWGYGASANYDRAIEPFVKAGLEFMVCPGTSCWSRIFPVYSNATVNIRNYVRDGAKFGAIGMLNTTWDDDGENLFVWNFYGTNWGGACAWRPEDADLEAFDAAYSQVSYGTPDDKVTRAINLLASCSANPLTHGNSNGAFYVKPFGALATSFDLVMEQAADLCDRTERALDLLAQAKGQVRLDSTDLDTIAFAARRLHFIGRARELQLGMAREYTEAVARFPEIGPSKIALNRAIACARELGDTVEGLQTEYRRVWLAENRPWWLDRMAGKYDGLIAAYRDHQRTLENARAELDKTGTPPDPAAVGLELGETSRRTVVAAVSAEAIIPADAAWWDARWPFRIPFSVEGAGKVRVDYPVELRLNFAPYDVAAESVRVVEIAGDGKLTPLLTQFIPAEASAGNVVFLMPGETAPGAVRRFAAYFDVKGSTPKPAQEGEAITVKAEGGNRWIENSVYRTLLGTHGAHLFVWEVKALGGLDITEPGRSGWAGFADVGREGSRDANFQITVEAAGPVMARIKATAPSAMAEKLFTFYAGKPYVEVMLANPTDFYWNYDNVTNFAKDKGSPGTAIFSNGHSEPVCASDEQIHAVARGASWGAKTRPDGLLLANITPEVEDATHMTGPGGGWGGTGIEQSKPAAHFIIVADKVQGDPATLLNSVRDTLDTRNQPKMKLSGLQARPGG